MTDFTKISCDDLNATNIKSSNIPFVAHNISTNGELIKSKYCDREGNPIYKKPYYKGEYKHLTITYTDKGNFRISGSLHKFYHNKNYNDFTVKELKFAIFELQKEFNLNLEDCNLRILEVGINIKTPYCVDTILDSCFLHKTTPFENKYDSEKGRYIVSRHSQYQIILYNKSKQSKLNIDNILRLEIRFTKMEKLNKLGIYNLSDLLKTDFVIFKNILLKEWDNILFFDLNMPKDIYPLYNYSNPNYWKDLLSRKCKSAYYKHRNKLKSIALSNSHQTQKEIRILIESKIDYLLYN